MFTICSSEVWVQVQCTTGCFGQNRSNSTKYPFSQLPLFISIFPLSTIRGMGSVIVGFGGYTIWDRSSRSWFFEKNQRECVCATAFLPWVEFRSDANFAPIPYDILMISSKSLLIPGALPPGCKVRTSRLLVIGLFTLTTHYFLWGPNCHWLRRFSLHTEANEYVVIPVTNIFCDHHLPLSFHYHIA